MGYRLAALSAAVLLCTTATQGRAQDASTISWPGLSVGYAF